MGLILRLTICIILLNVNFAFCQSKMVSIKGGSYIPLYGRDSLKVTISDFANGGKAFGIPWPSA